MGASGLQTGSLIHFEQMARVRDKALPMAGDIDRDPVELVGEGVGLMA